MILFLILVSVVLVVNKVVPTWAIVTDQNIGLTGQNIGPISIRWFKIYHQLLFHDDFLALCGNLIWLWIEGYYVHKFMPANGLYFVMLMMIVAPIYGKMTLFVWRPEVTVWGIVDIIFGLAGGLLSLTTNRWKTLTNLQKTQLVIFHVIFASCCIILSVLIPDETIRGIPPGLGAYFSGLVIVWGFYRTNIVRVIVAVVLLLVYLVVAITTIKRQQ